MKNKIMAFLLLALVAVYAVSRIAYLVRWIAPVILDVIVLCIAVAMFVYLIRKK